MNCRSHLKTVRVAVKGLFFLFIARTINLSDKMQGTWIQRTRSNSLPAKDACVGIGRLFH